MKRFLSFFLILISITLFVYSTPSESKDTYLIVPLPLKTPEGRENETVEVLSLLNKRYYSGKVKLQIIHDDIKSIPPGSLKISGSKEELNNIKNELSKRKFPYKEITAIKTSMPSPLSIAVLDTGESLPLHSTLKELGFSFTKISPESLKKGALKNEKYDLIIFPPGVAYNIEKALGKDGGDKLVSFIKGGGGYIGICAGAYVPLKGTNSITAQISFVKGIAKNQNPWHLGMGVANIKIKENNPITFGFEEEIPVLYWNGPIIEENKEDKVNPPVKKIAVYSHIDKEAFIFGGNFKEDFVNLVIKDGGALTHSKLGDGNVVLFSFHPELSQIPGTNLKLPNKYIHRLLFNTIYFVAYS
ncbi:MAG TPA: BPL-N domain-containing protein [Dictyoglomaceae bacterium]|nr:BPL-N domain-containing protein [Dictyoglomaceae bacterium]HOL39401.1 BPL-N domain-containing protein [Dictyoglomaceae bacterium]HPP16179.1 BPL-N domain-containing protein [Dictyoglomaceae bacterium]